MTLEDIDLADEKIIHSKMDVFKRKAEFVFESVYGIKEQKHYGQTNIIIRDWADFKNVKYVYNEASNSSTIVTAIEFDEIEKFRFIQVVKQNENNIIFEGWSDDTGYWIEYIFANATVEIKVLDM